MHLAVWSGQKPQGYHTWPRPRPRPPTQKPSDVEGQRWCSGDFRLPSPRCFQGQQMCVEEELFQGQHLAGKGPVRPPGSARSRRACGWRRRRAWLLTSTFLEPRGQRLRRPGPGNGVGQPRTGRAISLPPAARERGHAKRGPRQNARPVTHPNATELTRCTCVRSAATEDIMEPHAVTATPPANW